MKGYELRLMKVKTAESFKDSEKQIRKHVHEAVEDTMQVEVFNTVREVVLDRIQRDVYDVYNPQRYIILFPLKHFYNPFTPTNAFDCILSQ